MKHGFHTPMLDVCISHREIWMTTSPPTHLLGLCAALLTAADGDADDTTCEDIAVRSRTARRRWIAAASCSAATSELGL
uniref:Uncharacterized protein n=1 Tax=Rhodococcus sp. NS1 TaxID=402236 RepID=A0A097SQ10_9NOCA|nr:hypothetical protein LRS1606.184 [Rhodococcus sp. NS1]